MSLSFNLSDEIGVERHPRCSSKKTEKGKENYFHKVGDGTCPKINGYEPDETGDACEYQPGGGCIPESFLECHLHFSLQSDVVGQVSEELVSGSESHPTEHYTPFHTKSQW